jgi:hypothetical protein
MTSRTLKMARRAIATCRLQSLMRRRQKRDYDASDVALNGLRSYLAHLKGLPLEHDNEVSDPKEVLIGALADIAVGGDIDRRPLEGERLRYSIRKGAQVLTVVAQLQGGYGAYSPEQAGESEDPIYGIHDTCWDAEAEALVRIFSTPLIIDC